MDNNEIQSIISEAKKLKYQIVILDQIKSGKEATVYRVLFDQELIAMKLYSSSENNSIKNTDQYLLGKYYQKASHQKAIAKGNKFGKKLKHENWIKREFAMLEKLYELGAKIPKPVMQINDAIFMEYLGDNKIAAPRLCDVTLSAEEAKKSFDQIIKAVLIFWKFGIVHADLSEYNILWWKKEPYIIDFPQAIDRRNHPAPEEILDRDIRNITKFFGKYFQIDVAEIKQVFLDTV